MTRTFWVCAAAVSYLGGQRWVVSPAAVPAGPSAALCRQEGLSAGYHEDPEPAEGRQVEHPLPFPSPEDLPDPGIELRTPTLQADSLTSELPIISSL